MTRQNGRHRSRFSGTANICAADSHSTATNPPTAPAMPLLLMPRGWHSLSGPPRVGWLATQASEQCKQQQRDQTSTLVLAHSRLVFVSKEGLKFSRAARVDERRPDRQTDRPRSDRKSAQVSATTRQGPAPMCTPVPRSLPSPTYPDGRRGTDTVIQTRAHRKR